MTFIKGSKKHNDVELIFAPVVSTINTLGGKKTSDISFCFSFSEQKIGQPMWSILLPIMLPLMFYLMLWYRPSRKQPPT